MRVDLKKHTFGYSQNCIVDIDNKHDGVHITVIDAEHPTIISEDVIYMLVNAHADLYDKKVTSMKGAKEAANSGFLNEEIKRLSEQLEKAKFAQKIAKRNKVFIHN